MAEHRPRRALVTGGAGFIGSNFVRWWLGEDADLRVSTLDALTYAGSMDNLADLPDPSRHRFVRGDICDAALVRRVLDEDAIDTVVHFAAESHVDRSIDGPAPFIQTNVVGTFTLLEAARDVWAGRSDVRFHHVSTDEVYGALRTGDAPFCESTPYRPSSPYSASKAASDHLVRAYRHTFGLPVTLSNCSNNYGPHQHLEKFIPTVIRSCVGRQPVPVYGDGSNRRDWLYVTDHCRAIDAVVRRGELGETYCIGGDAEEANIDVARSICRVMDERVPQHAPHERLLTFVKDRPGHDWRYSIDPSKIRAALGWKPTESFGTGIAKTVAWYVARLGQAAGRVPA
jgi:dTDP-glucose 4,6-dehydratase